MGSCAEMFRYYIIWWKCSFHAYKVVDHLHIVKVWAQLIEQSPPYLPNLIAKSLYRLIEKWWLVVHNDYNTRKSTCINISQMRSDTIIKPFWYTDFDYGLFRYADVGSWRIWSVNRGCLLLLDTWSHLCSVMGPWMPCTHFLITKSITFCYLYFSLDKILIAAAFNSMYFCTFFPLEIELKLTFVIILSSIAILKEFYYVFKWDIFKMFEMFIYLSYILS